MIQPICDFEGCKEESYANGPIQYHIFSRLIYLCEPHFEYLQRMFLVRWINYQKDLYLKIR